MILINKYVLFKYVCMYLNMPALKKDIMFPSMCAPTFYSFLLLN